MRTNLVSLMLLGLLLAVAGSAAVTEYTTDVTNVTSLTITNAQHGMNSRWFGPRTFVGGVLQSPSTYSYTIDTDDYDIHLTWGSPFTGTVKLVGVFDSDTANDRDFKVTRHIPNGEIYFTQLRVCDTCTATNKAARTWDGKRWALAGYWEFSVTKADIDYSQTVRVWIDEATGKTVFGVEQAGTNGFAVTRGTVGSTIQTSVSGFPTSGAVPLGYGFFDKATGFGAITDSRP